MKRIILVGKAASGKDYFKDFLIRKGFRVSTSHTTRPKRTGEINGKTYHFTNNFMFKLKVFFGYFFEHKKFNGWLYGTSKKEMKKGEVFIFTPSGIKSLPRSFKYESIIVYFNIDSTTRKMRLSSRSDADGIKRRLESDLKDFKSFYEYDLEITDARFSCELVLDWITETKKE